MEWLDVMGLNQVDKLNIHSIDHIVMQAVDVLDTIKFYTEILGMTHSEFQPPTGGPVRQSLHFGAQKINLHDAGSPFCHMPKTQLRVVLIYVLLLNNRLATGSNILPIVE